MTRWSRRYRAALRKHLSQGATASVDPALRLGRQAVALKLEILDLARIHGQAMIALAAGDDAVATGPRSIARATRFLAETMVPREGTHPAAREADLLVRQLTRALRTRTAQAAVAGRKLEHGIARRREAEFRLQESGRQRDLLLKQAQRLQKRLRSQARDMLAAEERRRRRTSGRLRDEIAQTLLAINVRLLTLNKAARSHTLGLRKEIAGTRRLVEQSVQIIHRLSHELSAYPEA